MLTNDMSRGARSVAVAAMLGGAASACGSANGSKFTDGGSTSDASASSSGGGADSSMGSSDDAPNMINIGDASGCTPKTCPGLGFNCGQNSDGCGGVLDCGTCQTGQVCGGGGFSLCGNPGNLMTDGSAGDGAAANVCVASTCTSLAYSCGKNGDGCGGILDCGTCTAPEVCGGAGFSRCGSPVAAGDASTGCVPTNCTTLGYDCGFAPDGCGGVLQCGTCAAPETCGAGGFSKCGLPPGVSADGGTVSLCTPTTCSALGYTCGPAPDGCGGLLQCGTCTAPEACGAGGFSKCGLPVGVAPDGGSLVPCTPTTCATLGYSCGPASDGCGSLLQCGTCAAPQTCGGGGFDKCGVPAGGGADAAPACVPQTCQSQHITCGPAGDGCGNLLACGTCSSPQSCGGAGTPGQCGCQGLCDQLVACDGGGQTTISGTVRAGKSAWTNLAADPVPNVLVYIPNGGAASLQPLAPGAACRQCGADVSGSPLSSTYTDFDGTFTLTNVPAGSSVPVVIQLGRWRRLFTFNVPSCSTMALGDLNLPRNKSEGDIPLTAISTGSVDPLECVLLKMGVDQAEFTKDSGTGRIHLYGGGPNGPNGGSPGATAGAGTRNETSLLAAGGSFMNYDQVMLPCWGHAANKTAAELANLVSYADNGGHFFATHYSYSWLVNNAEFNGVAHWHPDYNNPGNVNWTLKVSTSAPPSPPAAHGGAFAKWLNLVGGLSNAATPIPATPTVSINNPRHDADYVTNGSTDWIDGTDPTHNNSLVEHFTFNTPVGGGTCGHAIFSDFHVSQIANGAASTAGMVFPAECTTNFSAQEKILEYMVFDLASCASPLTPTCTPLTCQQQSIGCGPAGDGCGGQLNCGTCTAPLTCGGGGVAGQCGTIDGGTCQAQTCQEQNMQCGATGDGCGAVLNCGVCAAPTSCVSGRCVAPDAGGCAAFSCQQQNIACGPAGDGCGNVLNCGSCTSPASCVGGQCVAPDSGGCAAASCSQQNLQCGQAGDGCGGILNCGTCPTGSSCLQGTCVAPDAGCTPATCAQQNLACGAAGDGCGNIIDCGPCTAPSTCVQGQCKTPGGTCTPLTCAQVNVNCGYSGDGCGGLLDCGTCVAPSTCGGGGQPGQCGGAAQ